MGIGENVGENVGEDTGSSGSAYTGVTPVITSIGAVSGDDYITIAYNTGIQLDGGDYTDGFTILVNGSAAGLNYRQSQSSPGNGQIVFRLTQTPEKPLSEGDVIIYSYIGASGSIISILGNVPAPGQADTYTIPTGYAHKENFNGYYTTYQAGRAPNLAFRYDVAWWAQNENPAQGVYIADLNTIASLDPTADNGLADAAPISHPKISVSDIPSRPGDAAAGALLFRYPAGGTGGYPEQKWVFKDALGDFKLPDGRDGIIDLWFQYDIFIPSNYYDRVYDTGLSKWVFLSFDENFSGVPPLFVMGRQQNSGDSGISGEYQMVLEEGDVKTFWPPTDGVSGGGGYREPNNLIVERSIDAGKWQRCTFHIRPATEIQGTDGVIEYWIKHGDGSIVKHIDDWCKRDWQRRSLNCGYFLGATDNHFTAETAFLVTNIIIAESSDNIDLTATT